MANCRGQNADTYKKGANKTLKQPNMTKSCRKINILEALE